MPRIGAIAGFVAFVSLSAIWPSFAQNSAPEPRWMPINTFSQTDRIILTTELRTLWGCGEPNPDGNSDSGNDLIESACKNAQASAFPLAQNADLLAIMIPSTGSCGDFQFAILGPVGSNGKRPIFGGTMLCGEGVEFAPASKTAGRPAVIFTGIDQVTSSGKEYHEDERWEWTGNDLIFVKPFNRVDDN